MINHKINADVLYNHQYCIIIIQLTRKDDYVDCYIAHNLCTIIALLPQHFEKMIINITKIQQI